MTNEVKVITGANDEEMGRRPYQKEPRQNITKYTTILAHCLIFACVLFIICLCFNGGFVFFSWHPLLMSIGWILLMTEAILVLNKTNVLAKYLSHSERIRYHWMIQTVAMLLIITAFAIVFINKGYVHKEHFTTWHAVFGLIGVIFCLFSCLLGVFALFSYDLRQHVKPNITKLVHCTCGILTFTVGGVSILLGVCSHWFERKFNDELFSKAVCFIVILFLVSWALFRPIVTCYSRFKTL